MKFSKQLRVTGNVLIILVVCFPVSIMVTLFTKSFWLWFEETSGLEAYGHSGPADWCYSFTYLVIVGICMFVCFRIRNSE